MPDPIPPSTGTAAPVSPESRGFLQRWAPGLATLLDYRRSWFVNDLIAGLVLTLLHGLCVWPLYRLCSLLWGTGPDGRWWRVLGLALALDVAGAASGLGAGAHWAKIGVGVAFALAAAMLFGIAMILTQHEITALDGRVRSCTTLGMAGLVAIVSATVQGGLQFPSGATPELGWLGLGLLTFLYGSGFTLMFTVLPKLGVAGNSAIMNVEPVFALVLAWLFLGQAIAPIQVVGALIVVGAVIWLGLKRGKS